MTYEVPTRLVSVDVHIHVHIYTCTDMYIKGNFLGISFRGCVGGSVKEVETAILVDPDLVRTNPPPTGRVTSYKPS